MKDFSLLLRALGLLFPLAASASPFSHAPREQESPALSQTETPFLAHLPSSLPKCSLPFHSQNAQSPQRLWPLTASGYASGEMCEELAPWIKAYGERGHQLTPQRLGATNHVWGLGIGIDKTLPSPLSTVGASFHISHLEVEQNVPLAEIEANSYQLALYGEYRWRSPFYLEGMALLAYNHYQGGVDPSTGRSHFHGLQRGLWGELGYHYRYCHWHIVPVASLFYTSLGLNNLSNIQRDFPSLDSHYTLLKGGIGLQLAYDWFVSPHLCFQPTAHFHYFWDLMRDNMQLTSLFTGAGAAFPTLGLRPTRSAYHVGLGFSTVGSDHWIGSLRLDTFFQNRYRAYSGTCLLCYRL